MLTGYLPSRCSVSARFRPKAFTRMRHSVALRDGLGTSGFMKREDGGPAPFLMSFGVSVKLRVIDSSRRTNCSHCLGHVESAIRSVIGECSGKVALML